MFQILKNIFSSKKNENRTPEKISDSRKERDELIRTLALVGIISEYQMEKHFPSELIDNLIKETLIEHELVRIKEKELTVFALTHTGKTYAKRNLLRNNFLYIRDMTIDGILHDLKLADIFLGLSVREQKTWLTPKAIRQYLDKKGHTELFENDGLFKRTDGKMVGVEVKGSFHHHKEPKELKKTLATYDDNIITASYSLDFYLKKQN